MYHISKLFDLRPLKKIFIAATIIVASAFLFVMIVSFTYKDTVVRYLKKYLDKHLTTEIEVSKIKFSFIKKFPNATIQLKNVIVKSGLDYNTAEFSDIGSDTLLAAKDVFFEFSLTGIIRGEYKLKNTRINNGRLLLLIDKEQNNNFRIWEVSESEDRNDYNFILQSLVLNNINIRMNDHHNRINLESNTKKTFIHAELGKTENYISIAGLQNLQRLIAGKSFNLSDKKLDISTKIRFNKNDFIFSKSSVRSEKSTILFFGEIKKNRNIFLSLDIQGENIDPGELENYFPDQLAKFNTDYSLSGKMNFKGSVKGVMSKNQQPEVNFTFNIENGTVNNQAERKKITAIRLNGSFSCGKRKESDDATLWISDFKADQGSSIFNGSLKITGLRESKVELKLVSEINLVDFIKFLNIDTLKQVSGIIKTDVFLSNRFSSLKDIKPNEFVNLNKKGSILCDEVTFKFKNSDFAISHVNGKIYLDDTISFEDLCLMLDENIIKLNGYLTNLPQFIFNKEYLKIYARLNSGHLDLKSLLKKKSNPDNQGIFRFPENIYLKGGFRLDNLIYGKFTADSVSGTISYNPGTFHFENLSLMSVEGIITGNATINQSSDKKLTVICSSTLDKIDIQKLFYSTNNFGQQVILSNNLQGKLSGTLNFTTEWDSNLVLNDKSIIANSDIEIKDGKLINYEPMLGLSRFIDVQELRDIKFKTLKNQIFIRDRKVTIPEMDIHSTAFHIKGSGIHDFDNNYDYRIQVELNEVLSMKARKKRREMEEFLVNEDNSGGLKIPLKIVGKGNIYKVDYDSKKAVVLFKNNINREKEEIRKLFNSSNNDSTSQNKPDNQNNKIIFDWDPE